MIQLFFEKTISGFTLELSHYKKIRLIYFILFFIFILLSPYPQNWGEVDASFWKPVSFFSFLSIPQLSYNLLLACKTIFLASIIASALKPNIIISLTALLFGWISLGYSQNFGKIDHFYNIPALILFFDFIVLLTIKIKPRLEHEFFVSYFRVVQWVVCLMYSFSGLRKLIASGTSWATSENMQILLWTHEKPTGIWLANMGILPNLLASGALILELFSFLPLLIPISTPIFLLSWALMHISIYLFLGPSFFTHMLSYFFFIPLLVSLRNKQVATQVLDNFRYLKKICYVPMSIYLALAIHQVAYKKDSWPLSSFPMYEHDLSKYPIEKYILEDENKNIIQLSDIKNFPNIPTLTRSLRKSYEKNETELLEKKLSYLQKLLAHKPSKLTLVRLTWPSLGDYKKNQ
ncbi:MAG: hypothetical protein M9962_09750 [Oligoflexia bacterium]|nr:hypothetical protein [Oligoflexia bacterium]